MDEPGSLTDDPFLLPGLMQRLLPAVEDLLHGMQLHGLGSTVCPICGAARAMAAREELCPACDLVLGGHGAMCE